MFDCKRFQKLVSESRDRELTPHEHHFLEAHRDDCLPCRISEHEVGAALNMLQAAVIEPEIDPHFDTRVLRRVQVQHTRDGVRYWSPALVGAAIAGLSVLASLQLIAKTAELPKAGPQIGEARLYQSPHSFPTLELERPASRPQ